MQQYEVLKRLNNHQLVAVIRADHADDALGYAEACVKGGFQVIELTYTTPGVESAIQTLRERHPEVLIGAGSVLDDVTAVSAIHLGVDFVVSPGFNQDIALKCNIHQTPYLPGCMTVSEMMQAMQYGSSVIKLFPGSQFGPKAISQFKGPLPQVSIMPTGGVDIDNVNQWFEQGAFAVGIGGSLVKGSFAEVEQKAKAFVDQVT